MEIGDIISLLLARAGDAILRAGQLELNSWDFSLLTCI
jgi:hypothetical protein